MPSNANGTAYHRPSVTPSGRFGTRIAAIDEEIRDVLAQAETPLQPFYGMMLYHLGLDVDRAGGGKRMRPLMCVLVYEALAGDPRGALPAAAALELLHNFTLIHDDIEDQDPTRHHRPTVWSVWGVPQAINTGDGMYAASRLAVQRLRERGFPAERILDFACLIDQACVQVCEGQFLDISFENRTDITVERYRAMAAKKTGARASRSRPRSRHTGHARCTPLGGSAGSRGRASRSRCSNSSSLPRPGRKSRSGAAPASIAADDADRGARARRHHLRARRARA